MLRQAKALIEKTGDHSSLAKDVCLLVDRELDILNSTELGSEYLVGLRKRLLNSFAKLITHESQVFKTHKPKFEVKK